MSKDKKFSPDQLTAADPTKNIWVQANAGTGKTTVLTQRLLCILFRNQHKLDENMPGILCLTYTKTGAGEMRNQILDELRKWSMADDEQLTDLLSDVSVNKPATAEDLAYARKIFYFYIDNPQILKIKTIHSFCEEILRRFPLEAGLSPSWTLISDSAQNTLLQNTFEKMISSSFDDSEQSTRIVNAFDRILDLKSEGFLFDLQSSLNKHYASFLAVDDPEKYREYFIATTKKILGVDTPIDMSFDIEKLNKIIQQADELSKKKNAPGFLTDIVKITQQYIENSADFEKYKNVYLTANNIVRDCISKRDFLTEEANRISTITQYLMNQQTFDDTLALFDLSMAFANIYQKTKHEQNLLDFDDLVIYTHKLFSKPATMGWVLSQMDTTLSHILVDEAQDTSPQQWKILCALMQDLAMDDNNFIFVVGDTKQSIFGFQNADPVAFATSREAIAEHIKQNYREFQEVTLDQSFRSLKPILETVDYFFKDPFIAQSTDFHNNDHKVTREATNGLVEMHNIFETESTGTKKNKEYAQLIADKIESVIKTENCSPKDIMVLVRQREGFSTPLSFALKKKGIDTAGSDRITLPKFPVIKDLLHLVRFCIDTKNDYSLCCVLKSPLFRLKEADIFNLCKIKKADKNLSIFDILHDTFPDIYEKLQDILNQSKTLSPYSFFTYILNKDDNRKKLISAFGNHIIDPLEEFLTMCLAYERTQPGTLYHFIKWFVTGDTQIKRDMDTSQGLRIMTIHGSKGLASKIVFLIDTTSFPKTNKILDVNYLHNNPNYDVWLWNTNSSNDPVSDILQPIIDKTKKNELAEYYRLLYVAMTRTRDQLYIYGRENSKANEMVWYNQLWNVLSQIPDAQTEDGTIRITHDTKFN